MRLSAVGALALLVSAACGATTPPPTATRPTPPASTKGAPATAGTEPLPGPDQARPNPPTSGRESRLIAAMLKRVSKARGIKTTRALPGVVLSRAELILRVKEHVAREIPRDAIRNEGNVLQLFGFIPTNFDYEAAEFALLEAQLAGYYEPADATMYLAADLKTDEAEATLAHELVHALQDVRWDLKSRSKYRPGEGDKSSAFSALAEGDATSAMFDVMLETQAPGMVAIDVPDKTFVDQIRKGISSGPGATAPRIMRNSLGASYMYGMVFVHQLRRRGGWREVDRAWGDAPTTSEQILHVDKWDAHEQPIAVATPTFAALGAGWTEAYADTSGELGVRLAFEEWVDPVRAGVAASGWGGDRGVLVRNGNRLAYGWRLRFDVGRASPDEFARRAYEAIAPIARGGAGAATACIERRDRGPLAIARSGNDLVIVVGPAQVDAAGSWSEAGNCTLARAWVKEIAAQP